jgi:ABC-2 type transport system ATP-binding protein
MIELQQVKKVFSKRLAVDDLNLTVRAGEIFGLLGHNGAGKSTSIGMILGQVWPTSGKISICGHDAISDRANALRKVGAIFEAPVFYDYLSGWRNLEILSHYTAPTSKERIRQIIEWVGLTGREQSNVRTYSHGMRARLALAQALLPNPDLLILDEPGDGLDPEGIHEMRQTILRLHREMGLTILLSSHLLTEVEQLCTRIAIMNQGRKVFEGTLAETRQAQRWVYLRVGDFSRAVKILRDAQLITETRDDKFVQLAANAETNQIVERLVACAEPVYEIANKEESLEDFYLTLSRARSVATDH